MLDAEHCEIIDSYIGYAKGVDYDMRKHANTMNYAESVEAAVIPMLDMKRALLSMVSRIDLDIMKLREVKSGACPL